MTVDSKIQQYRYEKLLILVYQEHAFNSFRPFQSYQ